MSVVVLIWRFFGSSIEKVCVCVCVPCDCRQLGFPLGLFLFPRLSLAPLIVPGMKPTGGRGGPREEHRGVLLLGAEALAGQGVGAGSGQCERRSGGGGLTFQDGTAVGTT